MNRVHIGSGNGLSSIRRQAITWTNAGLLAMGLLVTNFNEIRIGKKATRGLEQVAGSLVSYYSYPVIMLITMSLFMYKFCTTYFAHISDWGYVRIVIFVIWLLILMCFLVANRWSIMHVFSPNKGLLHWALAWSLCTVARSRKSTKCRTICKQWHQAVIKTKGISVSEHGHCQILFNNYYNEWPR